MHFKITLAVAALASVASAQNLTEVLSGIPSLSNLTSYLQLLPSVATALAAAQDVTLLAPSNDAFTKLLSSPAAASFNLNDTAFVDAFFSYHVVVGTRYASSFNTTPEFLPTALLPSTNYTLLQPGAAVEAVATNSSVVFTSGLLTQSTVTSANHNFTGGVVHVIDTFLTLPQNISATLVPLNFTAAAGALKTADIAAGPLPANLTAFIPNNAAFQAIANILANASVATLQGVLAYHLVPNIVAYSTDLTNMTVPTLANATLNITVEGDNVFVNSARVLIPNILVQEGVVHVIDEVLNPGSNNTAPPSTTKTSANFPGASSGTVVPYTSGIPAPTSVPGMASAAASGSTAGGAGASSTAAASGNGAQRPMQTGAFGAAALFGGAAALMAL